MKAIRFVVFLAAAAIQAADGSFTKTAYEQLDISVDFAARASDGITLDSVQALLIRTAADVTSDVIVQAPGSPVPAVSGGTKVILRVKSGIATEKYSISVRAIRTSTGEKLEGVILMNVF